MKMFRGARIDESLLEAAGVADAAEWDFLDFAYKASMEIAALMEAKAVDKTELAKRLGKSKPFVSKVLSGEHNLTFRTFTSIVHALGGSARVAVRDATALGDVDSPPANDPHESLPVHRSTRRPAQRTSGRKTPRGAGRGRAATSNLSKSDPAAAA